MTETTQNYYYVESDRDLLKLLFDQLPCQSLEDLLQLLDQKHIASFKESWTTRQDRTAPMTCP